MKIIIGVYDTVSQIGSYYVSIQGTYGLTQYKDGVLPVFQI